MYLPIDNTLIQLWYSRNQTGDGSIGVLIHRRSQVVIQILGHGLFGKNGEKEGYLNFKKPQMFFLGVLLIQVFVAHLWPELVMEGIPISHPSHFVVRFDVSTDRLACASQIVIDAEWFFF